MASHARKRRTELNDSWRAKIQGSMILKRLMEHVLSDGGIMEPSQVTAALGLIKKVLPDLSHSTGDFTHNFIDDLTERLMQARDAANASRESKTIN